MCDGVCTKSAPCKACRRETYAEVGYTKHRLRYLPQQVKDTRRKLKAMETEARRYGMVELASNLAHVNAAWDYVIDEGRAAHGYPDMPWLDI